jgi:N-acetyl sugar amidotransferase
MPETQEGITFDDMGVCQACQSSEQKMHINWVEREHRLRKILEQAKAAAGNNYDCIVPISGGKDSTFQLHVLVKVYGMKPLAVTFSHNWYSKTGWYNLQNALARFNVDHIMFTPNRELVNRLARKSLHAIGDTCWTCHSGIGAFPLQVAVRFKIPLLIWGESIAEASGRASYDNPVHKFDREYFTKVSAKLRPEQIVCEYLSERDLYPFAIPSVEECEEIGLYGIHLGDYMFWDDERQTEFVRDVYGWKETEIEGAYKRYKSAECIMPGMHDFTCYLKRGYGRTTYQASIDVRNGLLTREEAFALVEKHDPVRPEALDYYLKITGMTEEEFYMAMEKHRCPQLRDVKLPIKPKDRPNEERILPFAEQVIEEQQKI